VRFRRKRIVVSLGYEKGNITDVAMC